jgi:hypothetical protein
MFAYAAAQAGLAVANDQTDDTHLWDIIQLAITQRLAAFTQPAGTFF